MLKIKKISQMLVSNQVGLWYNLQLRDGLHHKSYTKVSNQVGLWYNLQLQNNINNQDSQNGFQTKLDCGIICNTKL